MPPRLFSISESDEARSPSPEPVHAACAALLTKTPDALADDSADWLLVSSVADTPNMRPLPFGPGELRAGRECIPSPGRWSPVHAASDEGLAQTAAGA